MQRSNYHSKTSWFTLVKCSVMLQFCWCNSIGIQLQFIICFKAHNLLNQVCLGIILTWSFYKKLRCSSWSLRQCFQNFLTCTIDANGCRLDIIPVLRPSCFCLFSVQTNMLGLKTPAFNIIVQCTFLWTMLFHFCGDSSLPSTSIATV